MKKFQITAAILALLSLVSFAVSTLAIGAMAGKLQSQTAAVRWSADGSRTAQVSAYLSPEAEVSADSLARRMPDAIDAGMLEWSLEPARESARLWAWSYSAECDVTIAREGDVGKTVKSGVSARAVACGGDFFLIHPLVMLSGSYLPTGTVLDDWAVIDNDLAWQLFGSPDVVGREIIVSGRRVTVTGVTETGSDGEDAAFYGEKPRIFLPYSLAEAVAGDLPVTAVEAVMPDPVSGFALELFEKAVGAEEHYVEYIENSARFTDAALRKTLASANSRGVRTTPVAFPYWENTAVTLTAAAANVYLAKLLPVILLALLIAAEVVTAYVCRRRIFAYFGDKIARFVRDRRQLREMKRAAKPPKVKKEKKPKKSKKSEQSAEVSE